MIRSVEAGPNQGYVKYRYRPDNRDGMPLAIMNGGILLVAAVCVGVLWYVRKEILAPFNRISAMPEKLAKGHLNESLKESRHRYFGRFVWGLNLLGERLEQQRKKGLALTKANKLQVLSLSHDIKTSLSAIRLYTKKLSRTASSEEGGGAAGGPATGGSTAGNSAAEIAGKIAEKAGEIEGFVQTIIKASQEDFVDFEIEEGTFYLDSLIGPLEAYYRERLALTCGKLVVADHPDRLVPGDADYATEALQNIIENALKYGDGAVIELGFYLEEGRQAVCVTNYGSTLAPHELLHIWDSFWRGSNAQDKQGSGLGLYITRKIITAMGGDVFARAEDGAMTVTVVFGCL